MNKYEEALNRICFNYGLSALNGETNNTLDNNFNEDIKILMELVSKETPMKPIINSDQCECPHCHIEECREWQTSAYFDESTLELPSRCQNCGGILVDDYE